ncbi:MAG TPA: PD-(D/E)XK nuclease family protein [Gaiellaceae bacterium]|nr:PD-(D/E)XK nuclease family protein [Gaiellaceae bacterium]
MPLTLLAGPANAGKVALLLDRYAADIAREPLLVVPNRAEARRVERDLVAAHGAVVGGWVGTFDDLFARIAHGNGDHRPVLGDAQRSLLVRHIVRSRAGHEPARSVGFAETLGATLAELEAGLVEPDDLDGELSELLAGYRAELDRLGRWDRNRERRYAAERVAGELDAWDGRPVYAYGFEDLTAAQWALVEALAARADVTVSLPYEPGRLAFGALERTAGTLARHAAGRTEELPPGSHRYARPALAHVERTLFAEAPSEPPPLEGAVRFLEGAGARGSLELAGDEILELVRSGTDAAAIAIVAPSLERWRTPLETVFAALGIPYSMEAPSRLGQTPFGGALLSLLRFGWLGGGRHDLYAFMRSPYSGLRRDHVDFLEGRLRGRAVHTPERVEEETIRLRGQPLPFLDALRAGASRPDAVRTLAATMMPAAHGLTGPSTSDSARDDLRAFEATMRTVEELEGWRELAGEPGADDVLYALERTRVGGSPAGQPGRVAVLDMLHARTRHYEVVFVLGLDEGVLPRRAAPATLLDDETRRTIEERSRRALVARPDPVAADRYLFYTACTRPTRRLYLVREAVTEDGSPREPSPFWDDVRALFQPEDVARWTIRRTLSEATWPLDRAPTERERLRATAALATTDVDAASALARANGWDRRLDRALAAFSRPTRLTHPAVLRELGARGTFGVTELELFADCSSMWFVERVIDPRPIDGRVDARLRGQVAHQALFRLFSGLPKRVGSERVEEDRLEETLAFLEECVREAVVGQTSRLELTNVQRLELEQGLLRDLGEFVRGEARSEVPLVPRRFEVSFGTERSAPELKAGLDLGGFAVSGKIDRVDLDPLSARGIVQDYKSGKSAHSAAKIESELRLQIPLYMRVLRDLLGVEPVGGLYRALAGERSARGVLRASAREGLLPGFSGRDYLDDDAFWALVDQAVDRARVFVGRIREGDVRHDPKGGACPSWCDLGPTCRVRRP